MAKLLNIEVVGGPFEDKTHDDVIYRLKQKPPTVTPYRYLVVADTFEQLSSSSFVPHLIVVRDFEKIKSFIKNKRYKSQIALEVLLSDIRYLEGIRVGKWFREVTELYKFSKRFGGRLAKTTGNTEALLCLNEGTRGDILELFVDLQLRTLIGGRCLN
jgi:hypothetical protein